MMIAPETFVNMHKDETYEELLELRDELIDEIIEFEESTGAVSEILIMPSPDVIYQMNLEYLGKLCELISEKYRQKRDGE